MKTKLSDMTKKEKITLNKQILWLIFANFILAFATGIFIVPNNICPGGMSGIAAIIEHYLPGWADVSIWIISILLFVLSYFTLGKEVTLKTLLSTIVYPLFFTLFYRIPFCVEFANLIQNVAEGDKNLSYLICCLFGGALFGVGVGMAYVAGGTTGGVDVFALLLHKLFKKVKLSFFTFLVDAIIIVVFTILCFDTNPENSFILKSLMNVICAVISGITIELIYMSNASNLIVDIVSDKWEEINNHIIKNMERGSSIFTVKGGYSKQQHMMIRTVISKEEYNSFYKQILDIDEKAFVTFTISREVLGNGFTRKDPDPVEENTQE